MAPKMPPSDRQLRFLSSQYYLQKLKRRRKNKHYKQDAEERIDKEKLQQF